MSPHARSAASRWAVGLLQDSKTSEGALREAAGKVTMRPYALSDVQLLPLILKTTWWWQRTYKKHCRKLKTRIFSQCWTSFLSINGCYKGNWTQEAAQSDCKWTATVIDTYYSTLTLKWAMIVCIAALIFMGLTAWAADWRGSWTFKRREFKVFNTHKQKHIQGEVFFSECNNRS